MSATATLYKPRKSGLQIFNMSFGFLGIQFGWGLQLANMSSIYEYLGAEPDKIPILWIAAPLTGLLVQPFIGHMSDNTWGPLGRRRPYFLVGAILSTVMLLLMPNAKTLLAAALFLWVLDASINISMEPFRAFVADLLPEGQRTRGFAMQSLFIGLGAVVASWLPWFLTNVMHISDAGGGAHHAVPYTVRLSFYTGAIAFFGAVLYTILTTQEYPPEDLEAFRARRRQSSGTGRAFREIAGAVRNMPPTMRQLGAVQLLTWLGLFCMWIFFSIAIARSVFGAADTHSLAYRDGIAWGGICFGFYSLVCFLFSFALPMLARTLGRRLTHSVCLLCGAGGLLSVLLIHNKWMLLASMTGVGIAWASTLSMPYAMLAAVLPERQTGVYMGLFNFFIVIPEILNALFFGWFLKHLLHDNRLAAVAVGGVCMLLAALLMLRVQDPQTLSVTG